MKFGFGGQPHKRFAKGPTTRELDFVQLLPLEISQRIFLYLHDCVQAISLVSWSWHTLCQQQIALLGPPAILVCPQMIQQYLDSRVQYFHETLQKDIHHVRSLPLYGTPALGCQLLEQVARSGLVTDELALSVESDKQLGHVIRESPDVPGFLSNSSTLRICIEVLVSSQDVATILEALHNLQSFQLIVCAGWYDPEAPSAGRIKVLPRLTKLAVCCRGCLRPPFPKRNISAEAATRLFLGQLCCPNLEELRMCSFANAQEFLPKLVTSSLRSLSIDDFRQITFRDIINAFRGTSARLQCLRYYNQLYGSSRIATQDLADSQLDWSFLSNLKQLVLRESSLSAGTIIRIVEATQKNLRVFIVSTQFRREYADDPLLFKRLLALCPDLQVLSLDIISDDHTMNGLAEAVKSWDKRTPLQKLYLTFCNAHPESLMAANSPLKFKELYICGNSLDRVSVEKFTRSHTECPILKLPFTPRNFMPFIFSL